MAKQIPSGGVAWVNRFSQQLLRYIEDVRSEQTKYQAALDQHPQKRHGRCTSKPCPSGVIPCICTILTIALGQAIELTDGLFYYWSRWIVWAMCCIVARGCMCPVDCSSVCIDWWGRWISCRCRCCRIGWCPKQNKWHLLLFSKYANNSISGYVLMNSLKWLSSSYQDLLAFPLDVRREIGYALHVAQVGDMHEHAKPFKGCGSGVYGNRE